MKVLVVEDEPGLRTSITDFLKLEGYLVESSGDFIEASEKMALYAYDCVLLDITLPNGNGLQLVELLKKIKSTAGIIIISAKNSLSDKVEGLDLGADDYLAKPFDLAELNSRLKALFRRKNFDGNNAITVNELRVLPDQRSVTVNGSAVQLTAKEFDLLLFFIANKNKVVSKNTIAEHLWGDHSDQMDSHDFIYVHLRNLRKKLMEKGCADYIHTIYGIGYNFKV